MKLYYSAFWAVNRNMSGQIRTVIDRLFTLEEGDGNLLRYHDRACALLITVQRLLMPLWAAAAQQDAALTRYPPHNIKPAAVSLLHRMKITAGLNELFSFM